MRMMDWEPARTSDARTARRAPWSIGAVCQPSMWVIGRRQGQVCSASVCSEEACRNVRQMAPQVTLDERVVAVQTRRSEPQVVRHVLLRPAGSAPLRDSSAKCRQALRSWWQSVVAQRRHVTAHVLEVNRDDLLHRASIPLAKNDSHNPEACRASPRTATEGRTALTV